VPAYLDCHAIVAASQCKKTYFFSFVVKIFQKGQADFSSIRSFYNRFGEAQEMKAKEIAVILVAMMNVSIFLQISKNTVARGRWKPEALANFLVGQSRFEVLL
jgi:hypothetical protein